MQVTPGHSTPADAHRIAPRGDSGRLIRGQSELTAVPCCAAKSPVSVEIFDADDTETPVVSLASQGGTVKLTVLEKRPATTEMAAEVVPFVLLYTYKPELGYSPIHEVMDGAAERMTEFYAKMWLDGPSGDFSVETVHKGSTTISKKVRRTPTTRWP